MNSKAHSEEKGFSLVESMIAMAILSVTFLGLAQLLTVGLQQNSLSRSRTMAVTVGQQQLEKLRATYNRELESGSPSSQLTPGAHGPETVTLSAPSDSVMEDNPFQVTWAVAVSGQQRTVTVDVVPQSQNDMVNQSLTIASVFSP
jgi:prepilin-type N-terminal cleavage/methylation domain-containing protein